MRRAVIFRRSIQIEGRGHLAKIIHLRPQFADRRRQATDDLVQVRDRLVLVGNLLFQSRDSLGRRWPV
jgi:hypothetical protein